MDVYEFVQRVAYFALGDKRYTYYDRLRKNLKLSREEMIAFQNRHIVKLIHHAYYHTKYYRDLMDSKNISPDEIKCKEDLRKLPILTKTIIKKNISSIKSDDEYGKHLFEVTSGGSTGNQGLVYKSPYFEQYTKGVSLRNNLIVGWEPCDKSVWLWGAPYEHQQLANSWKSRLGILINRRLMFNAFNYSPDDFPQWVDKIGSFKPKIIFGYSSVVLDFAKYMLDHSIKLKGIGSVVSTTETLRDRETIENAFQCPVYDLYGCREIIGVGVESEKGIMRIADDNVVLNISDGGAFLITALHSYGFPLINYKLGDRGENMDVDIKVNDSIPFSVIKLIIGRITDNFITKKNRLIFSSALSTYIYSFKINIVEQQFIQEDYDQFIINFVPDSDFFFDKYESVVNKAFAEYFGDKLNITFNKLDRIPVEKSGKKLMFKRVFLND